MGIFLQIIFALAVATALFGIAWFIFGKLRMPIRSVQGVAVHTVLSVRGGALGLEQAIEGLIWLEQSGTIKGQILIADCGLDEEGQALAYLVTKKHENIAICKAEDIGQWIVEKT